MVATAKPLIAIVFILCIVSQGICQEAKCDKGSIQVTTTPTGKTVQGKPEYKVDIFSACECKNSNIKLDCKGFQTVEPVPPASMVLQGDECVIAGDGSFIPPFTGTFFIYAWDTQFPLTPISCQPDCS